MTSTRCQGSEKAVVYACICVTNRGFDTTKTLLATFPVGHASRSKMADSTGPDLIDPMKASTLLELEGSDVSVTLPAATSPEARRTGLWIRGLDTRFRALWRSGRVIGIGTTDDMEDAAGQGRVSAHHRPERCWSSASPRKQLRNLA